VFAGDKPTLFLPKHLLGLRRTKPPRWPWIEVAILLNIHEPLIQETDHGIAKSCHTLVSKRRALILIRARQHPEVRERFRDSVFVERIQHDEFVVRQGDVGRVLLRPVTLARSSNLESKRLRGVPRDVDQRLHGEKGADRHDEREPDADLQREFARRRATDRRELQLGR
jgi:hypothetical protein